MISSSPFFLPADISFLAAQCPPEEVEKRYVDALKNIKDQRHLLKGVLKKKCQSIAEIRHSPIIQENYRLEAAIRLCFAEFLMTQQRFNKANSQIDQVINLAEKVQSNETSLKKCTLLKLKIAQLQALTVPILGSSNL